jgi:hypothetical protein
MWQSGQVPGHSVTLSGAVPIFTAKRYFTGIGRGDHQSSFDIFIKFNKYYFSYPLDRTGLQDW